MTVPVKPGATFEPGVAQPLFQARLGGPRGRRDYFVPSVDGQRILVVTRVQEQSQAPMTVVVNWLAAVKKIVACPSRQAFVSESTK